MTPEDPRDPPALSVAAVMKGIEGDVWGRLRRRLVDRGVTAYADDEVFDRVRTTLQHAADERDLDVLLLPELLGDERDWTLDPNLSLSSHRAVTGRLVMFVKRRLVLPLTRWLFEYSQENFRRQERLNRILLACIEELAIENARLRRDVDALRRKP